MLESIRDNTMYLLQQPKLLVQNRLCQTMTKIYQTIKPAIKEKQHKKFEYVNNNNLTKISKIATGISFLINSTNIKLDFCKAYTLSKQRKVHSKKLLIDTTNKLKIYLYTDLFNRKNSLSDVKNY